MTHAQRLLEQLKKADEDELSDSAKDRIAELEAEVDDDSGDSDP